MGLYGWWVVLRRTAWREGNLLASFLFVLLFVLGYDPGGRHVFLLSTYIPRAAVAGAGIGALIDASARWKLVAERGWGWTAALVTALADGRSVYAARRFPGLEDHFTVTPVSSEYLQVLSKE